MKIILRDCKAAPFSKETIFTTLKEVLEDNNSWPVIPNTYMIIGYDQKKAIYARMMQKINGIPMQIAFMKEIPPKDANGKLLPFGTMRPTNNPQETKLFLMGYECGKAYKLNLLFGLDAKGTLDISDIERSH